MAAILATIVTGCHRPAPPVAPSGTPAAASGAPPGLADLERACKVDGPAACVLLGGALYVGKFDLPDEGRAVTLFDGACNLRFSSGCVLLGVALVQGKGVAADPVRARDLFRAACDDDNALGCALAELPVRTESAITARDVEYAEAVCGLGNAQACAFAGSRHFKGVEVASDPARGLELMVRACKAPLPSACAYFGAKILEAATTDEEDAKGVALLEGACHAGVGVACTVLGSVYTYGTRSTRPRPSRATEFLEKACSARDADGCSALAANLAHGEGTRVDARRAEEILERQCRDGHGLSCVRHGALLFEQGQMERARASVERACKLGNQSGCAAMAARWPK